jgi:chorismate mutase / prephenate dehydratase
MNNHKTYNQQKPSLVFGIQGGKGSYNEKALFIYLTKSKISKYKIKYLYTTENVLRALDDGSIDRGQFAISNTLGGIVTESLNAISKHIFKVLEQYSIKITHGIMIRKDANVSDVDTIMSHQQVFAQCKRNLAKKYPHIIQIIGKDKLIDPSYIAKGLSCGKLAKNVAVAGNISIAKIYNLNVVDKNIQDKKNNYTTFLLVSKA